MTSTPRSAEADTRSARFIVFGLIALAATFALYMALGMPGMDHSATQHDMAAMNTPALRTLAPAEFQTAVDTTDAFVINVHTPYAGEITGTDAFIAFDTITDSRVLPADLDGAILLYCRSGRMSKIAGDTLVALGYTNVSHLTGGMDAWTESGQTLATAPVNQPAPT